MKMKSFVTTLFALLSLNVFALTVDGISFDDKVNVQGQELILNGVGIRKATFLKIKVYYGGLYLENKTNNPNDFLDSSTPKQIVMHFVRDVSSNDLKKTYSEAFHAANKETYASMLTLFEEFNSNFQRDMKKGERMVFTFTKDGVSFKAADFSSKTFGDANFSKAVLRMWFINPQDNGLTEGLLGK